MFSKYSAFIMIWVAVIPSIINGNDCGKNSVEIPSKASGQKLSKLESTEQVKERKRKRCCPYNFDGKLCRTVGDRVLCGYNRNIGGPESSDQDLELQNGCRIRKGRLECGYNEPPFLNSRRPPVWDYAVPEETPDENINHVDVSIEEEKKQKLNLIKLNLISTDKPKLTTRCVEIKERIVCRRI